MASVAGQVKRIPLRRKLSAPWLPCALALCPLWPTAHAQWTLKLEAAVDPREGVRRFAGVSSEGERVAGTTGETISMAPGGQSKGVRYIPAARDDGQARATTSQSKSQRGAPAVRVTATTPREGMRLATGPLGDGGQLTAAVQRETGNLAATAPRDGERLSDWLLRQPADVRAYYTGLQWQVPGVRGSQAGLKRDLLNWLAPGEIKTAAHANLAHLIDALPVTGRVPIPIADARWLQAHPKEDPVLEYNHTVVLPNRPTTVSVITTEGQRCTLPHRPGGEARDYLKACEPARIGRIDRAWLIQPDGSVRVMGMSSWNAQAQEQVAPGALLWAPVRDSSWPLQFSTMLVQFLATQGYDTILAADEFPSVAPAAAVTPGVPARDPVVTANDWGVIGLLQTPTARMAEVGDFRFHISRVYPYVRGSILMQPFDWLEVGYRYTDIKNRLYDPTLVLGTQSNKDKSIDFKVRLIKETELWPQLAVGVTDIGGTGLFSSEYVVANKRTGNFDWSLGIGWGNLGASGNVRNPLTLLSNRFETRQGGATVTGGTVNAKSYFRGSSSLFGGVQYHTPWDKWLVKAEYDGNNYQREPQANNQVQRSPINLGVVYRYNPFLDVSVGIERGNTLMLGLTVHAPLNRFHAPKVSDAPTPRVVASRPVEEPTWVATANDILAMSNWGVRQFNREGDVLQVVIESPQGAHWNERIERITAVLHRDAPAPVNTFELIFVEQRMLLTKRVIQREPWVRKTLQRQALSDGFQAAVAVEPPDAVPSSPFWKANRPAFGYAFVPTWQQNLGGPDGFLLFQAGVATAFGLKLSQDTAISGSLNLGLYDNYDKFKYTAPSNLPRVRTFLREYTTSTRLTLPNLQITHMGKVGANQFYSAYGGYLENMYAGVGGEWLYRPWHSPLAIGIDANFVQQRSFRQNFTFNKADTQTGYRVATGHATAYWDTGWNSTHVKLQVGRYLAKDSGATLDVSRSFANGVVIGAWATKTNITAEQFGEGSFDKGSYVRIPFDVMTTSRSGGVASLVYNPLTRDGGARLNRSITLYNATNPRGKHQTSYVPGNSVESGH